MKNNKGFATIEAAALMMVFITLVAYGVGMFGVIHSGILNSISARAYAWETYSHRAKLIYHRDNRDERTPISHHLIRGWRIHTITSEFAQEGQEIFYATERKVALGTVSDDQKRTPQSHAALTNIPYGNFERDEANPVWVKVSYGICLSNSCGGATQ